MAITAQEGHGRSQSVKGLLFFSMHVFDSDPPYKGHERHGRLLFDKRTCKVVQPAKTLVPVDADFMVGCQRCCRRERRSEAERQEFREAGWSGSTGSTADVQDNDGRYDFGVTDLYLTGQITEMKYAGTYGKRTSVTVMGQYEVFERGQTAWSRLYLARSDTGTLFWPVSHSNLTTNYSPSLNQHMTTWQV